jgi:hypothetical protein
MSDLITPITNINGSSQKELLEQWMHTREKLTQAKDALAYCFPHGRDFQPEGVYQKARDRHTQWMAEIHDIFKEVEDVALAIYEQGRR